MYPSSASSDSSPTGAVFNLIWLEESKPTGGQWLNHCPAVEVIRIQIDEVDVWMTSIVSWQCGEVGPSIPSGDHEIPHRMLFSMKWCISISVIKTVVC